jgi:hypothetical protein
MRKYILSIAAVILIIFSIGFVSSSAIAAEELPVQETIDLPTTQDLFGDKSPVSPFRDFVIGPDRNFFVTLNAEDIPVTKFTSSGEQAEIKAVAEGISEQTISSVSRGIALSSDQNVIVAGSREPYEFTPEENLIDQYSLEKSKTELARLVDVAADAQGNIYMADMNDQIRKVTSDGSVDTWQINKQVFNEEIPDFSTPAMTTTGDYLFVLMGQTDKLLKYTHGGELVDNMKLPQKEFGGSKKNRTIIEVVATKSGDLVALQDDLDNRILVLDGNGSIKRSFNIPRSISETGRTELADIAIGPDGNLYTISTTRSPASSDSAQTNFITSADIGLGSQIEETNKENNQSEPEEDNEGGDQANNTNERSTNGYWKAGATSSLSGQSSQDINALKRLVNSLMQLKVLIGMQQS